MLSHCSPETHLWIRSDTQLKRCSVWLNTDVLTFITNVGVLNNMLLWWTQPSGTCLEHNFTQMSCSSQNPSVIMIYLHVNAVVVFSSRIVGKSLVIQKNNWPLCELKRKLVPNSAVRHYIYLTAFQEKNQRKLLLLLSPCSKLITVWMNCIFYVTETVC